MARDRLGGRRERVQRDVPGNLPYQCMASAGAGKNGTKFVDHGGR